MAYPVCLPLRAGILCAGLWLSCRPPSRLAGDGLIWYAFMGGLAREGVIWIERGERGWEEPTRYHEIRHLRKGRDAACAKAGWDLRRTRAR